MRTLSVVAVALLVVLAGYGVADASTLTLSIQLGANQISTDGLNGPIETTYTVYGVVTGNDTTDFAVDGFTLHGGIASFMADQFYTGTGQIRQKQAAPNVATNYTPSPLTYPATYLSAPATNLPVFGTTDKGKVVNAARAPTWRGTGGIDNTYGAQSTFGKFQYYDDAYAPNRFQVGNGTPMVLYTGAIQAIANGDVTIMVDQELGQSRVYQINDAGLYTVAPTTVVPGSVVLHVGPASNTPPSKPVVNPTEILEASWTKEAGWNNPAHSVDVTAASNDSDGPSPLVYQWTMSKPGGGSVVLGATGPALHLTLADIASLGLPPYVGADDASYHWNLSVKAYDGAAYSPVTDIPTFVPEPATMGLLAFGVFGLIKRRRRA